MLRKASAIHGYAIAASDGRIGTVDDFLFEDISWLVRWLVVDTGKWLSGRKVLLPLSVSGKLDPNGREFAVELTKRRVKDSPGIDTDRPVSRQAETNIYDYRRRFRNPGCWRRTSLPVREATTTRIYAASQRLPDITFTPPTVRSATSQTSSSRTPIGASNISSSIHTTGGQGKAS